MTVSNLTDSEAPKIIVSQVKDIANFDQIRLVLCIFETKKKCNQEAAAANVNFSDRFRSQVICHLIYSRKVNEKIIHSSSSSILLKTIILATVLRTKERQIKNNIHHD